MPGARGKASVPEELDAHWAGKSGASRRDHAVSSRYFFGQNCFVKNPSLDQERAHSSATPRAWRQSPHPYTGTLFVRMNVSNSVRLGSPTGWTLDATASLKPGCPFCLPWMAPLYTRRVPSARNFVHRSIVQLQRPSPQPALTGHRRKPPCFWAFLRHRSTLGPFLRQADFVALGRASACRHRQRPDPPQHVAEQPPGQMSFRQQEPVVPRVLHEPSAGFHQPVLQARQ